MKKKLYEKPSMKVYELQQRTMLLAGSTTATMTDPTDYESDTDPFQF